MDNKNKIKFNLNTYINNDYDKFALLIDGCWGSGKTYLVNEFKKRIHRKR